MNQACFNFRSCGDGEGWGRIVCRKFLETNSIQTQFYRAFPQSRGKKPVSSDSALLLQKKLRNVERLTVFLGAGEERSRQNKRST